MDGIWWQVCMLCATKHQAALAAWAVSAWFDALCMVGWSAVVRHHEHDCSCLIVQA
jgi:hypothetical protein